MEKTFKTAKNRVGYVSKSKAGRNILTVEQDFILKKGDKIILNKPADAIQGLLERGVIDEETAERRKATVPAWKTFEADLLPRDNDYKKE